MRFAEQYQVYGIVLVSACHTDLGLKSERIAGYYGESSTDGLLVLDRRSPGPPGPRQTTGRLSPLGDRGGTHASFMLPSAQYENQCPVHRSVLPPPPAGCTPVCHCWYCAGANSRQTCQEKALPREDGQAGSRAQCTCVLRTQTAHSCMVVVGVHSPFLHGRAWFWPSSMLSVHARAALLLVTQVGLGCGRDRKQTATGSYSSIQTMTLSSPWRRRGT